jgi:hypothetical protein
MKKESKRTKRNSLGQSRGGALPDFRFSNFSSKGFESGISTKRVGKTEIP